MSGHKFNYEKYKKLDSPERKKILPVDRILSILDEEEEVNVADIGCGTGYLSIPLAKRLGDEGRVYAIDINSEMLSILEERAEGLKNIETIKSDENDIPIKSNIIDISFLITVFHELKNPERFIEEIVRISKDKHRIGIIDWTAKEREMGPPIERAIAAEKTVNFFEEAGYKLAEKVEVSDHFYGLVFERK